MPTNCSITDWESYMTRDNQTRDYLESNPDVFTTAVTHSLFMDIVVIIISFFITIPNMLLIWGTNKTSRKPLNISKKLFIYNAMTNMMTGLAAMPYFVLSAHLGLPCFHVYIANSIGLFSVVVGTETVLTMSVLRFIAIVKPFRKSIHPGKIGGSLVAQFFIALSSSVLNFAANAFSVRLYPPQCLFTATLLIVSIALLLLSNVYSMIYIKRQKSKNLSAHVVGQCQQISSRRYEKAIWRLLRVSVVLGVCFLPSSICYVYVGKLLLTQLFRASELVNIFDVADMSFIPCLLCPGVIACVSLAWDQQIKKYYRSGLLLRFNSRLTVDIWNTRKLEHLRSSNKSTGPL